MGKPMKNSDRINNQVRKSKKSLVRDLTISSIRALEGEGNERKFVLSFSSEEPYTRWFGSEILDHSEGCMDLTRLNSIGCMLFNHDRNTVVGKINKAWVENCRGCAEVEFDEDDESEKIFQKVKNKTLQGVSVGYNVDSWEEVLPNKTSADGKFTGPCSIARKWMPYEISVVSVPADATVGVGRDFENPEEFEQEEIQTSGRSLAFYERQLQININKERESTGGKQ